MSKIIFQKKNSLGPRIIRDQDSQSQLRDFLTTFKKQHPQRILSLQSRSLNFSPRSLQRVDDFPKRECSLPSIGPKVRKFKKTGINEQQQHIISNYLNAHLRVRPIIRRQKPKKKTKQRRKGQPIGGENKSTIQTQLQVSAQGRLGRSARSTKQYSLRQEPMKNYVKEKLERKRRQWKANGPMQLITYFYQLGRNLQKVNCSSKLENTIPQIIKIPSAEEIPSFIKHYQPSWKQISLPQLIKSTVFRVVADGEGLYFGEVRDDKRSGIGILVRQGYCFEGQWADDRRIRGLEKSTAGTYTGSFAGDKKQGRGQFRWHNGQVYSGQWLEGKKHGSGLWTSPLGDNYMGEWRRGVVEGQGIHTYHNGQRYEGTFKNFLKHGYGKQRLPNGDTYEGQYSEGQPHGHGLYIWSNGATYQGAFIRGVRQGLGTLKDPKGFYLQGQFVDQLASGNCQITYGNGQFYSGQIRQGRRNGKGILRIPQQRKVFTGYWANDEFGEQTQ